MIFISCTCPRLIPLHAGLENGWVPNCALVLFKSGMSTGG